MDTAELKHTVLIVDDDVFLCNLLSTKLSEKFKVQTAGTGEAALEILQTAVPDLVLLDILLPGLDGFDVLEKMKKDPKIAAVPVVILSNLGQDRDKAKSQELGAERFVVKAMMTPDEIGAMAQEMITAHVPKAA